MADCVLNPAIPYVGSIPQQAFIPNKIIRIQGRAPNTAHRFGINLQCGPRISPLTDTAVQVSVSFIDGYIALNSFQTGRWGEEQQGILLIQCGQNFEIVLSCDYNQYKVAINGEHYCDFPQRIHYSDITHLIVDGDVSVSCISYETSPVEAASTPPLPLSQNEDNDFEKIYSSNAPLLENQPLITQSDNASPPSYDVAISVQPTYPTDTAPGAPGVAPLHEGGTFALPYRSTSLYALSGIYPLPPEPGNCQPPLNTVPHNSPLSRLEPEDDSVNKNAKKCFSAIISIFILIIIIILKHQTRY